MRVRSNSVGIAILAAGILTLVAGCNATRPPKPMDENPVVADLVDYRNGLALLRDGRADEAIQLLSRAKASYPRNANVANAFGLALLYKRDYERAVKAFSDALTYEETMVEALNNRGVAYMEWGILDKAEADFDKLLDGPEGREKKNARFNMAILRTKQDRWVDAERDFSLVLADDAAYMRAYRERGLARFRLDDFRGAMDDLLRYMKVDQKDASTHYYAALCLLTKGQRDLAARYMERTVFLAPDSEEGKRARRFLEGETYVPRPQPEEKK